MMQIDQNDEELKKFLAKGQGAAPAAQPAAPMQAQAAPVVNSAAPSRAPTFDTAGMMKAGDFGTSLAGMQQHMQDAMRRGETGMRQRVGGDNFMLDAGTQAAAYGQGYKQLADDAMKQYALAGDQAQKTGKLSLDQYLGVAGVGQEAQKIGISGRDQKARELGLRGGLEVQQRAQQEAERQGGYGRSKDVEMAKYLMGGSLAGKSATELEATSDLVKRLVPSYSPGRPADGTPGMAGGFGVQPVPGQAVAPGQVAGGPPAQPGAAPGQILGGGNNNVPVDTTDPNARWKQAFGKDVFAEADKAADLPSIMKLLNSKVLQKTPTHLEDGKNDPAFDQKLGMVEEYIKNQKQMGHDYDRFLNPTRAAAFGERAGNIFGRPNEMEQIRSMIRQRKGGAPESFNFQKGVTGGGSDILRYLGMK